MSKLNYPKSSHFPVEIFGYPIDNSSIEAQQTRSKYWCPFMDKKCDKKSRIIPYPMGVCSVLHMAHMIPICPNRLLQDNIVLSKVSKDFLGGTENILMFQEVGLQQVGTFDFVLVKHKPISSKVDDFCIVELQSDSTTQTGQLVKAISEFFSGKDVSSERYTYGMNTYNTIKLVYTQILNKGQTLEKWERKIIWALPKYIFENIVKRFNLSNLDYNPANCTIFYVYDLVKENNIYKLHLADKRSSTIENLLKAFTNQTVPKIDKFINKLETKIKLHLGITLS
jgi:hypothetical protein